MIDPVLSFDHVHVISKEPEAWGTWYTETRDDRCEAHSAQRRSDSVDLGGGTPAITPGFRRFRLSRDHSIPNCVATEFSSQSS
jgi:hypothetical protein